MFDVAVITPVFNTQDYLHRCVKSVLSQAGVSLQYILVDDGSTDNSFEIASFYQRTDDRVTLVRQKNQGQGVARNAGIRLADAEFVYFVDSDDHLGEGTLKKLLDAAREHSLDICSPNVPDHYFAKPLEHIACVPCKSQFIRLNLLRQHQIFQPDVSSGQDGVFSHLVLAHCERVGMISDAEFHYTHARKGSTFAQHLKRSDLIPSIVQKHYAAIVAHYDRHNLWDRNALRLLNFVSDETLRNRIKPHFETLSDPQRLEVLMTVRNVVLKALPFVPDSSRPLVPAIVLYLADCPPERLVSTFGAELAKPDVRMVFDKSQNFKRGTLTVCKYSDASFAPPKTGDAQTFTPPAAQPVPAAFQMPRENQDKTSSAAIKDLAAKLDFAINSLNNSTVQIKSQIHVGAPTLESGIKELVGSVTTLPSRLPLVHLAIESIFSQTIRPSKVVLWISEKVDPQLTATPELKNLQERGLDIRFVEDVGPHTKLVYALKAFPDNSIFTFDDDIIYPVNMVQALWTQHLKFPEAVVSNWARELAFDEKGSVLGVRSGRLLTPANLEKNIEQATRYEVEPTILGFPYGTSGVLYPPGALHPRVHDAQEFRRLCPKEDDIWFRVMGILNGTRVVPTNLGINPLHHCITGSQAEALRHDNHGLQQNLVQMQRVFKELDLYRLLT